jgi:type II secretory pathway component PulC
VWIGQQKESSYAVIDRGKQKGVWTYEIGEAIEKGLAVSEIKTNAAILKKDEYTVSIKLFAKGFEWISKPKIMTAAAKSKTATDASPAPKKEKPVPPKPDLTKEIKTDGRTVVISKTLASQIRADTNVILSHVAVKGSLDSSGKSNGFKIVSIDKGSIAEKAGIRANDIIQEVNGIPLSSSDDIKKAQEMYKNSGKFEVKILRGNQTKMLYYEIR